MHQSTIVCLSSPATLLLSCSSSLTLPYLSLKHAQCLLPPKLFHFLHLPHSLSLTRPLSLPLNTSRQAAVIRKHQHVVYRIISKPACGIPAYTYLSTQPFRTGFKLYLPGNCESPNTTSVRRENTILYICACVCECAIIILVCKMLIAVLLMLRKHMKHNHLTHIDTHAHTYDRSQETVEESK